MSLTFLGKLLPYFLAVRLIKSQTAEGVATLRFEYLGKVTELKGNVRRFDNGEWLFIENVSELIQKRIKLENELMSVKSRIESFN